MLWVSRELVKVTKSESCIKKKKGTIKSNRVDQSDYRDQGNEWVQIKIKENAERNEQLIDDGVESKQVK